MTCHFCKSRQDMYASYYKNDRTEGKWKRGATIHSCQNVKCPYHYNLKDGEIKEYPSESVMTEKIIPYWEGLTTDEMQIGLDKQISEVL